MSRDNDEFMGIFGFGFAVGTVLWFVIFCAAIIPDCQDSSHRTLGSKGRVCFANHTCRENLKCVYIEGLEPWSGVCVQK